MYRVVAKHTSDGSAWEMESCYEYDAKEIAETLFNSCKEVISTGDYANKYKSEVIMDTPTALCYHSTKKNEPTWKGVTRLVYIEEVA